MNPNLSLSQLLSSLSTSPESGLSKSQVVAHEKQFGKNSLPEQKPDSWFIIFLRQFQDPLIYILLIAAAIIFVVGHEKLDAFIISGVLLFNAIIGTIQEGRTRAILESLKHFITTQSIVIRSGRREIVEDEQLVPGDIVVIQAGERIAADMRIINAQQLMVDESILTGESRPVAKVARTDAQQATAIHDQDYMLFKGTYVNQGSGLAVVLATGTATHIGAIHKTISGLDSKMPLRAELERLSYFVLLFILALCVVLFVIGMMQGLPIQELFVMLTALFICVVPEGLPVVLTLVLVTGVYRMAKKQILVKNLQAVEGLGRTQVIIVDKTGTLTRNELMVTAVCINNEQYAVTGQGYERSGTVVGSSSNNEHLNKIGMVVTVLNNAEIDFDEQKKLYRIKGDPTEAALAVFGAKLGLEKTSLEKQYALVVNIPFDSQNQYHAGLIKHNDKYEVWIIGSPEKVAEACFNNQNDSCYKNLLDNQLRVIAVAVYALPVGELPLLNNDYVLSLLNSKQFKLLGYCGMTDSIRQEVPAVLKQARAAGLQIVMATGDHTQTAVQIAKQVGIYQESDNAVDGRELLQLSDDQIVQGLPNTTVYSRVTPTDKLRLVHAYKKAGKLVAMTGDGVNDAPSLVAADIGIAMGNGTQVAQDASDIILLDDSFVNIINAIKQGRHIFYTLKRVISYFFATNLGEILIVLFALLAKLPLPLTAAQILWLNLVTDGFLDVALSMEPEEPGLLQEKKWLSGNYHLIDKSMIITMFLVAIPMAAASLWIFTRYYEFDMPKARTMALLTMAMFQWFNAWNCRSDRRSILSCGLFSNKWLIAATILVLLLQILLIYAPFMNYIFKTVPLSLTDWELVIAISFPIVLIYEIRKWFMRRAQVN